MKKLSTYLFLVFFSFSASSFAESIRDLEIEGMSLGDSLLDYFSEKEILKNQPYLEMEKEDLFKTVSFYENISSDIYDGVSIMYKDKNNKFIIHKLKGIILYSNNIKDCYSKKNEITEDLSVLFKDIEWENSEYKDEDGFFSFSRKSLEEGNVSISCYDWSSQITDEKKWTDNLRVTIETKEYTKWLSAKDTIYSD